MNSEFELLMFEFRLPLNYVKELGMERFQEKIRPVFDCMEDVFKSVWPSTFTMDQENNVLIIRIPIVKDVDNG